jgi:hypothetical protein
MRSIPRTALLALMSALVLGAIGVSSAAAAAPEFLKEGKPLTETVKFSSTAQTSVLEGTFGAASCKATISGETKGSKEVTNVSIKFEHCSEGEPCTGTVKEGKELKGKLGLITATRVGLLLESSTGIFVSTKLESCLYNSVIGGLIPTGVKTSGLTLQYHEVKAKQEFTHFEGESVIHQLTLYGESDVGLEYEPSLTLTKAIELKV